jgi:hypothetical protein
MVEHHKEMELQDFVSLFGLLVLDRFKTQASCQVFLGLFFTPTPILMHTRLVPCGTGLLAERARSKVRDGVIALILFHKTHRRKSGNYTL